MVDERLLDSVIAAAQPKYVSMVRRDILTALTQFQDLYPSTDYHVYNDGRRLLVVTLNGTVPVNYKGNVYNIPVCLYLSDTHPYNPPMCYVRPTSDMVIKASSSLDSSGRIYLPYLHQWKYPASDLSGLITIMVISFTETCPVFAKSSSAPNTNPSGLSYFGSSSYSGFGSGYGYSGTSQSGVGSGYQPYGQPSLNARPWYPYQAGSGGGFGQNYPANFGANQSGGSSTGNTPFSGSTSEPAFKHSEAYGTIQPEHIRSSILSAVQDKLRSKLREKIGTAQAELQSIKKTTEDLTKGEQRIKALVNKMQQEETQLNETCKAYRSSVEDMKKIINKVSISDELPIDESLDTTTPLYRQLLNSYVEDNAIEDCIYYLSQALKNCKLDLDSFLKNVRALSRQQFYLRAIIIKGRQVGGLDRRS